MRSGVDQLLWSAENFLIVFDPTAGENWGGHRDRHMSVKNFRDGPWKALLNSDIRNRWWVLRLLRCPWWRFRIRSRWTGNWNWNCGWRSGQNPNTVCILLSYSCSCIYQRSPGGWDQVIPLHPEIGPGQICPVPRWLCLGESSGWRIHQSLFRHQFKF